MNKYLIKKPRTQNLSSVQNSSSSIKRIRVDFNLEILKEHPEKKSWSRRITNSWIVSTLIVAWCTIKLIVSSLDPCSAICFYLPNFVIVFPSLSFSLSPSRQAFLSSIRAQCLLLLSRVNFLSSGFCSLIVSYSQYLRPTKMLRHQMLSNLLGKWMLLVCLCSFCRTLDLLLCLAFPVSLMNHVCKLHRREDIWCVDKVGFDGQRN